MTTIVDCFKQATGPADETAPDSVAVYKWGLINTDRSYNQNLPVTGDIVRQQKLGQFYESIDYGNQINNQLVSAGILVNGIPLYAVLGKSATVTTDTRHTLSCRTVSEPLKPRYHLIEKYGSKDPNIYYASLFSSVKFGHVVGEPISFILGNGHAMKFDKPTITLNTPSYPSDISTVFDLPTHFKVGANGSESAYSSLVAVSATITQPLGPHIGDNGDYDYINEKSPIQASITATFSGNSEEADQFIDDKIAQTKRSILWKASKSRNTSHYLELDSNGATACVLGVDKIQKRIDDIIGFNVTWVLENPTVDMYDGVNDDFYTIPT